MSIEKVSDVFAFVAKEAEFTKSILFAETEVPEINPEERAAIASVLKHIEASYIALLNRCRRDMYDRADAAWQKTMDANWNRDKSIWERARVELPLVVASSYIAVAYWWIDEETSERPGALALVGELWAQVRKRDVLMRVAEKRPATVFITKTQHNLRTLASPLAEGAAFADLAREIVCGARTRVLVLSAA